MEVGQHQEVVLKEQVQVIILMQELQLAVLERVHIVVQVVVLQVVLQ